MCVCELKFKVCDIFQKQLNRFGEYKSHFTKFDKTKWFILPSNQNRVDFSAHDLTKQFVLIIITIFVESISNNVDYSMASIIINPLSIILKLIHSLGNNLKLKVLLKNTKFDF